MTWLELDAWLGAEMERLDMRPFREEPRAGFLQREAALRASVDDWIEQCYLQERSPPLEEELRRWVSLRLLSAKRWLIPLAGSSLRRQDIDPQEWLRLLLLAQWPEHGLRLLHEEVLRDAPSAR